MGTQSQPEGRRAFALAVAGVHQNQATPFALRLGRVTQNGGGFDFHTNNPAQAALYKR